MSDVDNNEILAKARAQLAQQQAQQQAQQEQIQNQINTGISSQLQKEKDDAKKKLNSAQLDTNLQERLLDRLQFFNSIYIYNLVLILLFVIFLFLLGILRGTDEIKDEGPSKETTFIFVIGGIFIVSIFLSIFLSGGKESDNNLKAALNLTDSMTNLYQARISANDLSSSMATILTPNFRNQKQYDNFKQTVANHYNDIPNQVQSNIIKATYNAVQPAESQP